MGRKKTTVPLHVFLLQFLYLHFWGTSSGPYSVILIQSEEYFTAWIVPRGYTEAIWITLKSSFHCERFVFLSGSKTASAELFTDEGSVHGGGRLWPLHRKEHFFKGFSACRRGRWHCCELGGVRKVRHVCITLMLLIGTPPASADKHSTVHISVEQTTFTLWEMKTQPQNIKFWSFMWFFHSQIMPPSTFMPSKSIEKSSFTSSFKKSHKELKLFTRNTEKYKPHCTTTAHSGKELQNSLMCSCYTDLNLAKL